MANCLAVRQLRIKPEFKALLIQNQRHAWVDCLGVAAGGFWNQAAVMGESAAEVVGGRQLLHGGIDGLRGLIAGPVKSIAPPQLIQVQLAVMIVPPHIVI